MSTASTVERQMLELINKARAEVGLHPLQLELDLNAAAEDHSDWMLKTDTFSHTGVDGSSPGDRMKAAGFEFSGSWSWGENVAWQSERGASGISDDVEDLFDALMNSDGHRANILKEGFDYVGIGVETGDYDGWDAVMVTQTFASTSATVALDTVNASAALSRSLVLSGTNAAETLSGGAGADILKGRGGADTLKGLGGADELQGQKGQDLLTGGKGADILKGGLGADVLRGNNGQDRLFGGNQKDLLDGGLANDSLTGGSGADRFVFGARYGTDTITDFQDDLDLVRLDDALWSGTLNVAEVIRKFADVQKGNVVFDFGDEVLIVEGIDDASLLRDDLNIV
ncbi:CAP domain-containing protein [Tropicimonas aquimaris]|uniref:CAP domain-containing protein n=1 Tax=Tropicimonas aquimaris TaxID=914152 RepID=A0ABW3ILJ3_9RHOB